MDSRRSSGIAFVTSPTRNSRHSAPTMYATLAGGRLTESALAPLVSRHYFIRWPGRAYGFTACGVSLVLTAVQRVDRRLGAECRNVDGRLSACGPVQCSPCALGLNICAVPDLRRSALVPHSPTVVSLQRRAACIGSSGQGGVVAGVYGATLPPASTSM